MCELFALSASDRVDIRLSLSELARHGGETAHHRDGWGVAFGDGRDFRLFKETGAAASSPLIRCLADHPIRSHTVVAHIRYATQGAISSENTQPFVRELGGIIRVFAHNGDLGSNARVAATAQFQPAGDTDSEAAFCTLLDHAAAVGQKGPLSFADFAVFAENARTQGPANVIYAEPDRLLIHADRRKQQDGTIAPPGLWMLCRRCTQPDGSAAPVGIDAGAETRVVLFASVPLTAEQWIPLPRGTVVEAAGGEIRTNRSV